MQKITQKAWWRQLPTTASRARRYVINPLGGINLIEVAVDDENKCEDRLPHRHMERRSHCVLLTNPTQLFSLLFFLLKFLTFLCYFPVLSLIFIVVLWCICQFGWQLTKPKTTMTTIYNGHSGEHIKNN